MKINPAEKFVISALYRSCERTNFLQYYFEGKITRQVKRTRETLQDYLLGDLHTHSIYSDGVHTPDHITRKTKVRGLDAVAITDHLRYILPFLPKKIENLTYPPHFASCEKAAKRYGITVIPGMEIESLDGHILALFPTYHPPISIERIQSSLPSRQTIQLIHEAGGVAIAAHVFRENGLGETVYTVKDILDGVEEFNPSAGFMEPYLAERLGIAEVAGSDAHTKMSIGLAFTAFPRDDCLDEESNVSLKKLIECIKLRKTTGHVVPASLIEGQVNKTRWANPFYALKSVVEYFNDEQRKVPRRLESYLVE